LFLLFKWRRDEIFRFYSALSLSLTPPAWWLCEQRTPRARRLSNALKRSLSSSFCRLLNALFFFFFFFVQKEAQQNRNKESRNPKLFFFVAKHKKILQNFL
jgi:hypothetical protein